MMSQTMLLAAGCLAVATVTLAYPVYGPNRYRAYSPLSVPVYSPHAPKAYPQYYEPYPQDLSELVEPYPQDIYNYNYYQVPYYFPETTPYYYDEEEAPEEEGTANSDETEDIYPQEWYNQDSNAKANAYFLQNLILAQMYKDATQARYPVTYGYPREDLARDDYDQYVYGEPVQEMAVAKEDQDVSQLKSLVRDSPKRQQGKGSNAKAEQRTSSRFVDNTWTENKRDQETPEQQQAQQGQQGQGEVVMLRPANPPRPQPTFHQRSHEPSAYDAIKKLLQSQQQKKSSGSRQPQKRSYNSNEDALVEQLDNLKKSA